MAKIATKMNKWKQSSENKEKTNKIQLRDDGIKNSFINGQNSFKINTVTQGGFTVLFLQKFV